MDAADSFFEGLESERVCSCIKHFPGHGDTSVDSHKALPTLSFTEDELFQRELLPFQRVIKKGVSLVMTSHILFPHIDPDNPATLSEKILRGILREKLGYNGLIVTDDLDMDAVSKTRGAAELPIAALNSGCDLFIVARFPHGDSDKPLIMAQSIIDRKNTDHRFADKITLQQKRIGDWLARRVTNHKITELSTQVLQEHQTLNKSF